MIKVKRTRDDKVDTKIQGKALDIIEELLNATVAIIAMLVAKDALDKQDVIGFIDDFAQQVKDYIEINN